MTSGEGSGIVRGQQPGGKKQKTTKEASESWRIPRQLWKGERQAWRSEAGNGALERGGKSLPSRQGTCRRKSGLVSHVPPHPLLSGKVTKAWTRTPSPECHQTSAWEECKLYMASAPLPPRPCLKTGRQRTADAARAMFTPCYRARLPFSRTESLALGDKLIDRGWALKVGGRPLPNPHPAGSPYLPEGQRPQ